MVTSKNNISTIKFDKTTKSYLAYPVNSSGLRVRSATSDKQSIVIEVYNSRKDITPGYLVIPITAIPELITDLNQIYNNVIT